MRPTTAGRGLTTRYSLCRQEGSRETGRHDHRRSAPQPQVCAGFGVERAAADAGAAAVGADEHRERRDAGAAGERAGRQRRRRGAVGRGAARRAAAGGGAEAVGGDAGHGAQAAAKPTYGADDRSLGDATAEREAHPLLRRLRRHARQLLGRRQHAIGRGDDAAPARRVSSRTVFLCATRRLAPRDGVTCPSAQQRPSGRPRSRRIASAR